MRIALIIVLAIVVIVIIVALPDIKRYLKIRSM
ncbi:DUF6893 family small protein [Nonomuraea endophytica]